MFPRVLPAAFRKEHEECAFTPDGSHLLAWGREHGVVRLLSVADGSVRWSIQLPNWSEPTRIFEIRSWPDQLDRFACVVSAGQTNRFLADVQVQVPALLPAASLVMPTLESAAAAAAASSMPAASPADQPPFHMRQLFSDPEPLCFEYHPTRPLLIAGTRVGTVQVFDWQTSRIVREVKLKLPDPTR